MTANEVISSELSEFKTKSKVECLHSLSNSISFFLFSQWLANNYEDATEKHKVRDEIFKAWTRQITSSTAPVFSGINEELSKPQTRWTNIIAGTELSTESYADAFSSAIREIKVEFNKITD